MMWLFFGVIFAAGMWLNYPDAVVTRQPAKVSVCISIGAAALFGAILAVVRGWHSASMFASGYVMELALSVDNLVAFGAVFAYFNLPKRYEPRILSIGIWSAIGFRLLFAVIGSSVINAWGRPIEVVFAVLVAYTALAMLVKDDFEGDQMETVDHSQKWYIKMLGRWPVTGDATTGTFFMERTFGGRLVKFATPLLLCLVAIEVTDIMFSFDSIPTVISVSREPLIIYSAMMFAILGLRAMYFMLRTVQDKMKNMSTPIAAVLLLVSLKLAIHAFLGLTISPVLTLVAVAGFLAVGYFYAAKGEAA